MIFQLYKMDNSMLMATDYGHSMKPFSSKSQTFFFTKNEAKSQIFIWDWEMNLGRKELGIYYFGTIPILRHQMEWVQKMAIFADSHSEQLGQQKSKNMLT